VLETENMKLICQFMEWYVG